MDDDANAMLLWSNSAADGGVLNVSYSKYTPQTGWSAAQTLIGKARAPAVALAGHGLGTWAVLSPWTESNPWPDYHAAAVFHFADTAFHYASFETYEYQKTIGAPYVALATTGGGVFETKVTTTYSSQLWTRHSHVTGNYAFEERQASTRGAFAVVDDSGRESAFWWSDHDELLASGVGAIAGVQVFDSAYGRGDVAYKVAPGGHGIAGWSKAPSPSKRWVSTLRWSSTNQGARTVNAEVSGSTYLTSLDVAVDGSGNSFLGWIEGGPAPVTIKVTRAPVDGEWDPVLTLRQAASADHLHVGADSHGNATLVWIERDSVAMSWSLWWTTYRPGLGWMTPAMVASDLVIPHDILLATGGDGAAAIAWGDGLHVWAAAR
ncbi:MAG: hypothetical protein QM765_34495 [Myxococcales bacterium]